MVCGLYHISKSSKSYIFNQEFLPWMFGFFQSDNCINSLHILHAFSTRISFKPSVSPALLHREEWFAIGQVFPGMCLMVHCYPWTLIGMLNAPLENDSLFSLDVINKSRQHIEIGAFVLFGAGREILSAQNLQNVHMRVSLWSHSCYYSHQFPY